MNKNVIYVGLGLLALYLLTRKKKDLVNKNPYEGCGVAGCNDTPPVVIGQPVEKPLPPTPMPEVTQMPVASDWSNSDWFNENVISM